MDRCRRDNLGCRVVEGYDRFQRQDLPMPILQSGNPEEHVHLPPMQAADIVGWSLNRRAKAQPVTWMQKVCMLLIIVVLLGFFIVLILKAVGLTQADTTFFQYMFAMMLSAIMGYLFGNNTKVSL